MEFKVYFISKTWIGRALYINTDSDLKIGLIDVDKIRYELNISLPLIRIAGTKNGIFSDYFLILTEEQAKETKLFSSVNCIEVKVDVKALNGYCGEEVVADKEPTGEITAAWIKIIDPKEAGKDQELFAAWKAAGFPIDWSNKE